MKTKTVDHHEDTTRFLDSFSERVPDPAAQDPLEYDIQSPLRQPNELVDVPIDSLESNVGYSSLMRQMSQAFIRRVAYYRSKAGGSLPQDEARKRALHAPADPEEVEKLYSEMLRYPVESLDFIHLHELQVAAPGVAEAFWELVKAEGRKEFESGHLAANASFPVGYMKGVWNIAKYIGVRESFISEWKPRGGIELSLIDMLTQSYFQWQFWVEQTVKRSQTREKEEHPDYTKWKKARRTTPGESAEWDGFWIRPTVDDVRAVENAAGMADRWHRAFMRTLRQLRDLRRYASVNITNTGQVNIAADGGQQINQA